MWVEKLGVMVICLNSEFLIVMVDICLLLSGVCELVDVLSGKVNMGIIINGFIEL